MLRYLLFVSRLLRSGISSSLCLRVGLLLGQCLLLLLRLFVSSFLVRLCESLGRRGSLLLLGYGDGDVTVT